MAAKILMLAAGLLLGSTQAITTEFALPYEVGSDAC